MSSTEGNDKKSDEGSSEDKDSNKPSFQSSSEEKDQPTKANSPSRAKFKSDQGKVIIKSPSKSPSQSRTNRPCVIEVINTAASVQIIFVSRYPGQDAFTQDLVEELAKDVSELRDATGINYYCNRRVSKSENSILRNKTAQNGEYYPRRGFFSRIAYIGNG